MWSIIHVFSAPKFGGILAVSLLVAACASSSASSTPASGAPGSAEPSPGVTTAEVTILDNRFDPPSITVSLGTTVTWTNGGDRAHTATADDGSFASGSLGSGATFQQAFETAGSFTYHCANHGSMKATVVVVSRSDY